MLVDRTLKFWKFLIRRHEEKLGKLKWEEFAYISDDLGAESFGLWETLG